MIAGDGLGHLFLLLALKHVDVARLAGLAAAEVDQRRLGRDPAAQDSQVAHLAHELVVSGLEHLGHQRALLGGQDLLLFRSVGLAVAPGAEPVHVGRAQTASGDQVEQFFDAQVLASADA